MKRKMELATFEVLITILWTHFFIFNISVEKIKCLFN